MSLALTSTASRKPFKRCPLCKHVWGTPLDFHKDADLHYIGHQDGNEAGDTSLMMFNHSCGTTLSIEEREM